MSDTKHWFRTHSGLAFLALLVTLAVGIAIGTIVSDDVASAGQETVAQLTFAQQSNSPAAPDARSLQAAFRKAAETIEPAVVNISTTSIVEMSAKNNPHPEMFKEFFGDEFFQRFFGGPGQGGGSSRQRRASLGSGVIVDAKGYIVSNYHVVAPIEGQGGRRLADRIEIQLAGGETYQGEVVGVDPETDLAVIKIASDKPLPVAKVGNSGELQVGDWVLAVGSPFGYEQTLTAGIVSAMKRVVPETFSFSDYIQTDAAINPGNSGGPLVNINGEVIGINTFISTRTGQYAGIGFAIPSAVVINSYNQLISGGKIQRGWLGVSMNTFPMTSEMASYFGVNGNDPKGVKNGDGVVVTQLIDENGAPSDQGPAAKAGIQAEDVIVQFGDREVSDLWDLRSAVANTPPGKRVPVTVVRKGQVLHKDVELAERTIEEKARAESKGFSFEEKAEPPAPPKEIGLEFQTLAPRDATELGLGDEKGVLILDVTTGSLAEDAGLQPRWVITHVNGKPVATAKAFKDEVTAVPSGQGIILRVIFGAQSAQGPQKSVAYTSFIKP